MTGSKFLQRIPAGPQRLSPRDQLALRGALRPAALGATPVFGALDGAWEDWCDSPIGVERYAGDALPGSYAYVRGMKACKREFPGGALIPGHPQTLVGQFLRFEAMGLIPSPLEYGHHNLWVTMYTDYKRFNHLFIWAQFIPGMLPWIGGGFAFAEYNAVRQEGFQKAAALGIPEAERDGWSLDYTWKTMWKPAVTDAASFVGKVLAHGPWIAIGLKVLEAESKKIDNPPMIRAVYAGLTKNAGLLAVLIGGAERIRQPASIALIGQAMQEGAAAIQGTVSGELAVAIREMGKTLSTFAPAIGILLDPYLPLLVKAKAALDEVSLAVLGVRYTKFLTLKDELKAAVATKNADGLETFRLIKQALAQIKHAFEGIKLGFVVEFLDDLTKPIDDIYAALTGALDIIEQVQNRPQYIQRPATQGAAASTAAASAIKATSSTMKATSTSQTGAQQSGMTGTAQRGTAESTSIVAFPVPASILPFMKRTAPSVTTFKPATTLPRVGPAVATTLVTAPPAPEVEAPSNTGLVIAAAFAAGGGLLLWRSWKATPLSGVQRRKRRKVRR